MTFDLGSSLLVPICLDESPERHSGLILFLEMIMAVSAGLAALFSELRIQEMGYEEVTGLIPAKAILALFSATLLISATAFIAAIPQLSVQNYQYLMTWILGLQCINFPGNVIFIDKHFHG